MEQSKHIMRILSLSLCCLWTTLWDSLPANRSFSNHLLSTSQHFPFCPTNQLVLDSHLVSSHMFYYTAPTTAATKRGQIAYPSCHISTSVLFLLLCAHWSGSTMCIVFATGLSEQLVTGSFWQMNVCLITVEQGSVLALHQGASWQIRFFINSSWWAPEMWCRLFFHLIRSRSHSISPYQFWLYTLVQCGLETSN